MRRRDSNGTLHELTGCVWISSTSPQKIGAAAGLTSGVRAGVRARGARFELEPLFQVRVGSVPARAGASPRELAPPVWEWHRATPAGRADSPNPWDIAHAG